MENDLDLVIIIYWSVMNAAINKSSLATRIPFQIENVKD